MIILFFGINTECTVRNVVLSLHYFLKYETLNLWIKIESDVSMGIFCDTYIPYLIPYSVRKTLEETTSTLQNGTLVWKAPL